jgi:predicted RNase H-like nuclease
MARLTQPQTSSVIIGFDSAWTDSAKAPGAICAITFDARGQANFIRPEMVTFEGALEFIDEAKHGFSFCLIALDQPTIVPNPTGIRPVERVAASVISYVGGGVQPSNRSKTGMFDDHAPVWAFKDRLGAIEAPEDSRLTDVGLFLMEVFPALALTGLHSPFAQRLGGPKYNPQNKKKFRILDWQAVTMTVVDISNQLGLEELSDWASEMHRHANPRKGDQDQLDAVICAIVGLIWRACDRNMSAMIGDMQTGYMVTPVSTETRLRLEKASTRNNVRFN